VLSVVMFSGNVQCVLYPDDNTYRPGRSPHTDDRVRSYVHLPFQHFFISPSQPNRARVFPLNERDSLSDHFAPIFFPNPPNTGLAERWTLSTCLSNPPTQPQCEPLQPAPPCRSLISSPNLPYTAWCQAWFSCFLSSSLLFCFLSHMYINTYTHSNIVF